MKDKVISIFKFLICVCYMLFFGNIVNLFLKIDFSSNSTLIAWQIIYTLGSTLLALFLYFKIFKKDFIEFKKKVKEKK